MAFDPRSLQVKKRYPIGVAKTPTGLAYDARTKRLFIGCRDEPKMVVMDAATGKVINSFPLKANGNNGTDEKARRKDTLAKSERSSVNSSASRLALKNPAYPV